MFLVNAFGSPLPPPPTSKKCIGNMKIIYTQYWFHKKISYKKLHSHFFFIIYSILNAIIAFDSNVIRKCLCICSLQHLLRKLSRNSLQFYMLLCNNNVLDCNGLCMAVSFSVCRATNLSLFSQFNHEVLSQCV